MKFSRALNIVKSNCFIVLVVFMLLFCFVVLLMHLSMFSPRGGGGGRCGTFDKTCPPESGEFDWKVRPHGRGDLNVQSKRLGPSLFLQLVSEYQVSVFSPFSH